MEIKKITIERLERAIDEPLYRLERGLYMVEVEDVWLVIDNSAGEMWTEEFDDEETAKKWLEREE